MGAKETLNTNYETDHYNKHWKQKGRVVVLTSSMGRTFPAASMGGGRICGPGGKKTGPGGGSSSSCRGSLERLKVDLDSSHTTLLS